MAKKFEHDFIFLRSASLEGKSHGGFQWPLKAGGIVKAPDWSPKAECGGGLHGIAHGLGDWELMAAPSSHESLWYVCGALKSEAVELVGKVKVPRCRVLYVGSFAGAMELISPAMTERILEIAAERTAAANPEGPTASGYQGAATASGDQGAATASGDQGAATASGYQGAATASGYQGAATASGDQGAATASGYQGAATASGDQGAATASGYQGAATASGYQGAATASGKDSAAMSCGFGAKVRADRSGCALFLVERDGDGQIVAVWSGISGKDCDTGVWYTLTGGNLESVR